MDYINEILYDKDNFDVTIFDILDNIIDIWSLKPLDYTKILINLPFIFQIEDVNKIYNLIMSTNAYL